MEDRRRVRGSKAKEYDGIKFKSLAEVMVYKTLLSEGIKPKYEKKVFFLQEGLVPTVPFYTKNRFKRKNRNIEVLSSSTCKDSRPLDSMLYTPDFTFDYAGKHIIIEVKGFATDVFTYRFKLFRLSLEGNKDKEKFEIWEIHTKKQLLECLNHLKQDNNDNR